jgi:hypothetical protein
MTTPRVWQEADGRWFGKHGDLISQPFKSAAAAWWWLDRQVACAATPASTFAILVTERSGNTIELCRVGTNPEVIAKAARRKRGHGGRLRYRHVEIKELASG